MPQITIYLDQQSSRLIEDAAARADVSLSKWAREKLVLAAGSPSWPPNYSRLLGSIDDLTFESPPRAALDFDQSTEL